MVEGEKGGETCKIASRTMCTRNMIVAILSSPYVRLVKVTVTLVLVHNA